MKKNSPIQQQLFKILETEEFDKLTHYHDPESWGKWDVDDRLSLAVLFVKNGERLFSHDRENGWKSFEHSLSIAPESAAIRQQIATWCLPLCDHVELLNKVLTVVEEGIQLDPKSPELLLTHGMTLYRRGLTAEDETDLRTALEKLEAVTDSLARDESEAIYSLEFLTRLHWGYSSVWHALGKISGEAVDFCQAVEQYRETAIYNPSAWQFWTEFGDACSELAFLLANTDLAHEAVECYRKSIKHNEADGNTWLNLGYIFHYIFDITLEGDHAECAREAYANASKLQQDNDQLWVKWGALLVSIGKINGNIATIQEGIDKFQTAQTINPKHPKLNSLWADALLILAGQEESLPKLREAEERIVAALKDNAEDARSWYIYGLCLNEFGRYFDEPAYFRKALDKLNRAVELDPKDASLWHGIAITHLDLADSGDAHMEMNKSLRAFSRAIDLNHKGWPQLWNDWGVTLMKMGERSGDKHYIEAALVKFENVMKTSHLAGYEEQDLQPDWLYNYGCALDFLGDYYSDQDFYEKAIHMLTRALQLDPNYHHARYNLAITLTHLAESVGDLDLFMKAQEQFVNVLAENDEEEFSWNEWGVMCMHAAELVAEECLPEKSKEWLEQAEPKLLQAAFLGSTIAYYNLACLYAITNHIAQSFQYLHKAKHAGALPPTETLQEDLWLENIRHTEEFRDFIARL